MYKLDLTIDRREAAAIERRRALEIERQNRVFNAQNRIIGVFYSKTLLINYPYFYKSVILKLYI